MAESQDDDLREMTPAEAGAIAAASADTEDDATSVLGAANAIQAASDRNTTRIGLGLRYDMSPGTALKVQYDIIEVKDDKSGLFSDLDWAANETVSELTSSASTNPDGTNVLTISIDTVF